jgi:hypothetical protein
MVGVEAVSVEKAAKNTRQHNMIKSCEYESENLRAHEMSLKYIRSEFLKQKKCCGVVVVGGIVGGCRESIESQSEGGFTTMTSAKP